MGVRKDQFHIKQEGALMKLLFRQTDTYEIDAGNPNDVLFALMPVPAIDAEKCSRGND